MKIDKTGQRRRKKVENKEIKNKKVQSRSSNHLNQRQAHNFNGRLILTWATNGVRKL